MSIIDDLLVCLRFFSRLPVPTTRRETTGIAAAAAMTPVAGAVIGALAAAALLGASALGLPPVLAAALGVAALVAITGALHEDGLADCADGFGGGATRAKKLEIMRDSRIGTFGACALVLSLVMRVMALASLTPRQAALAMIIAAVASRSMALLPLALLPPARADGLGAAAGRPEPARTISALVAAAVLGLAASLLGPGPARGAVALVLAATGALAVSALAGRQIGGQTGDVAGAAQQVAEIAVLLTFAAGG